MEYEEVKQGEVHNFEEVGAVLEGKLVRKEQGKFGDNYIIDVDGKELVVFGCTVLNTKLAGVSDGTNVRITKLEDKKSEGGRIYKDFTVEVAK